MTPPKSFIRFLRWFCREDYIEEIEGDLTEMFEKEVIPNPRLAKWKFRMRILKHFRPEFIKAFHIKQSPVSFYMIQHILLVAFRNFSRHKRIFAINLVGLTAGLTSVLLIYLWVQDELAIDQFHASKERLYQVRRNSPAPENTVDTHSSNSVLLPEMLETELPEVEYVVPMRSVNAATVSIGRDRVHASGSFAGKDFFKAFSFPLIYGDKNSALTGKYNMAISSELATRLFGSVTNCIGKPINWDLQRFGGDFVISAVFEKPAATSEQFDFLLTHEMFLEKNPMDVSWDSNPILVDFTLRPGVDAAAFEDKLNKLYKSKREGDDLPAEAMFIQKYTDLYLHNRFENGVLVGGRIDYVMLFSIVAIFILVIACINFMNLSTARAQSRMKEIGVKKGIGVMRRTLIFQHLTESVVMSMCALFVSIVAVVLILPEFNTISGKQLTLYNSWDLLSGAFVITLFTGLISGSYPAFYLSGFKPVDILKGRFTSSKPEVFVRRGLVVFQFTVSIILIIGVAVVYRQLKFIQSWDVGFRKDNIVLIERQGELNSQLEAFLERAREVSGVLAASSTGASITDNTNLSWGHKWEGQPADAEEFEFSGASINYGLIEAPGIEMKYGRSFSKEYASDEKAIILNETAVKRMGMTDPVGKWMSLWGTKREIVGVVKDYHFQSLYTNVKPQFLLVVPERTNTIVLKLQSGSEVSTLESIKALFKEFNPAMPFEFKFLDDEYQALYFSEQRISTLAQYFAIVAIVLSCLGLFGLATFSSERRTKEISIRKVLGCSALRIMRMLTLEFSLMVLIAAAIALPIAWVYSAEWLGTFAYRTELPLWLFVATGLTVLAIAILTVGMQAIKTARINPAVSLKTE